jgi:3-hydroxymyristoyl/3-hydroxydecanoyl-(acyl carrier protein) dehydratase
MSTTLETRTLDILQIKEILPHRYPLGKAKVTARVGDKIVCEGEISFAFTNPGGNLQKTASE